MRVEPDIVVLGAVQDGVIEKALAAAESGKFSVTTLEGSISEAFANGDEAVRQFLPAIRIPVWNPVRRHLHDVGAGQDLTEGPATGSEELHLP